MIRAHNIKERLPALRRHAYILTGSRTAADAALAIAVARLPRDANGRPMAHDDSEIWRAILDACARVNCPADAGAPALLLRLLSMDLTTRAMVVLTMVERLPLAESAAICGLSPDAAARVLARGRDALGARTTQRVMNL